MNTDRETHKIHHIGIKPATDNSHLDDRDARLLAAADHERLERLASLPDSPAVGEWVRLADGTMRRVSHVWDWGDGPESIQTSDGGSWHLHGSGTVSFSGSLHPGIKPDTLTLTGEQLPGWVWIWHHGYAAAHNGVDVRVSFRVWEVQRLNTPTCSCAINNDGSVTKFLCSLHADNDPCATMAAVTGRRRTGTIRRGTCTACGWSR